MPTITVVNNHSHVNKTPVHSFAAQNKIQKSVFKDSGMEMLSINAKRDLVRFGSSSSTSTSTTTTINTLDEFANALSAQSEEELAKFYGECSGDEIKVLKKNFELWNTVVKLMSLRAQDNPALEEIEQTEDKILRLSEQYDEMTKGFNDSQVKKITKQTMERARSFEMSSAFRSNLDDRIENFKEPIARSEAAKKYRKAMVEASKSDSIKNTDFLPKDLDLGFGRDVQKANDAILAEFTYQDAQRNWRLYHTDAAKKELEKSRNARNESRKNFLNELTKQVNESTEFSNGKIPHGLNKQEAQAKVEEIITEAKQKRNDALRALVDEQVKKDFDKCFSEKLRNSMPEEKSDTKVEPEVKGKWSKGSKIAAWGVAILGILTLGYLFFNKNDKEKAEN